MPIHRPPAPLSDDDIAFIQRMRQAVAALPDVPAALTQRALGVFPAAATQATPSEVPAAVAAGLAAQALALGALRRLVASLSFDSWAQSGLAAGMRSVRSTTRHLLFSAEGRDIDLRIAPDEAAAFTRSDLAPVFTLSGQILGPDETGEVQLSEAEADAAPRQAVLDELGEFRMDGLHAGAYRLTLRVGGDEIALPVFDVGDRSV